MASDVYTLSFGDVKEDVIIVSEIKRYNHFYSFRLIKYKSFIFVPAEPLCFYWEGTGLGRGRSLGEREGSREAQLRGMGFVFFGRGWG